MFIFVIAIIFIAVLTIYFTVISNKPLFILCNKCNKYKLRFLIKNYEIVDYSLDGSGFYEANCRKCKKGR